MRKLAGFHRTTWLTVITTTILLGASLVAQEMRSGRTTAQRPTDPDDRMVPPFVEGKYVWPEFRPGAAERGEADEPDIANMGADWSHEMELWVKVDRTEFHPGERIRVLCDANNTSANHIWLPPFHPLDRYLRARVRVFDSKGRLRPMTEFYKHEGRQRVPLGGSAGAMVSGSSMNPGVTYRIDVFPNLIYDMTRPGEYWVVVEIPFGEDFGHPGKGVFFLRAQPIKVTVKPELLDLNNMPRMILHRDRP